MASADSGHAPGGPAGTPPPDGAAVRGSTIPLSIGQRRFSRSYGRIVSWLKILLPTLALVLIVVAVLWTYFEDETRFLSDTLTKASDVVTEHLEVSRAKYSGVSDDGQHYTVTADTVEQESVDARMVNFKDPRADINLKDGSWALITAETGTLDRETQVLELNHAVNLFHDQGYEFRSESATLDLAAGSAYGFDPVEGQGPFGHIEAEGFQIINRGEIIQLSGHSKVVIYNTD